MVLQANNPEQEEAVETLEVEYAGDAMEIGFNVNYLLDALAAVTERAGRVRRHGWEFELLDPGARRRADEVRRHAHAPVGAGVRDLPLRRLRVSAISGVWQEVELALDPARNYIYGPNGAGKTSLLEAIFLLGRGRSFRTRQARTLIRYGQPGLAVYGEVDDGVRVRRLGVGVQPTGRLEKRIDGDPAQRSGAWRRSSRCRRSDRTAIGSSRAGPANGAGFSTGECSTWNTLSRSLATLSPRARAAERGAQARARGRGVARLDAVAGRGGRGDRSISRRRMSERLASSANGHAQALLGQGLSVEYRRGWRADLDFVAALDASSRRDRSLGHTEPGPHRADLVLQLDGHRVQDEASRGQQKLAAAALVLAQESVVAATATSRQRAARRRSRGRARPTRHSSDCSRVLGRSTASSSSRASHALEANKDAATAVFHVERGEVHAL